MHRYLSTSATPQQPTLSLQDFLFILRKNYGWYVDQPPPGMTVNAEALVRNRKMLERRLRDLGLLLGVNDAESMKLLKARPGSPQVPRRDPAIADNSPSDRQDGRV